jgi:hypothetical protein
LPYPATEGNFVTVYNQVQYLSQRNDVEIVTWMDGTDAYNKKSQQWNKESPSLRIKRIGCKLNTLETKWQRRLRVLSSILTRTPSRENYYYPRNLIPQIISLPKADLEIYHHSLAYGWLSKVPNCLGVKRVVMIHDSNAAMLSLQQREEKSYVAFLINKRNVRLLKSHERDLGRLVNELWFVSLKELSEYKNTNLDITLRFVPPAFDTKNISKEKLNWKHQKNWNQSKPVFGLLGDLAHTANIASAKFIIDEICPILNRKGFTGKIKIVGRNAPQNLLDAAQRFKFVEIVGFLEKLDEFWAEISMMLVPNLVGTGVRIKMLESIAFGIPVLTHTESAKTIAPSLANSPLVITHDGPNEWAQEILTQHHQNDETQRIKQTIPKEIEVDEVYRFLDGDPLDFRYREI